MPKQTHSSGGGGSFRCDVEITDYAEDIKDAIKDAIQRALTRIGLKCVSDVTNLVHTRTGRLKNSITFYTDDNAVYVGSNVEYAQFEEEGTSKRPPHPYLRPAAENGMDKWKKILKDELENG